MTSNGEQRPDGPPEYNLYRARKGPLSRLRKPDLAKLRERESAPRGRGRERPPRDRRPRPRRRRGWLKWVGIVIVGWLLVSLISFSVSAQIQSMKLDGDARDALSGNPWLLAKAQNILVIGTDSRGPETLEPGAAQSADCYEQQAVGSAPHDGCAGARADTLMVVRAGGGVFRKLSVPRDSYAEIPGQSPQKINAAYAFGGAKLQIKTIEDFLGISIDHVVIMNFTGFADFIDSIGGVTVDVPVKLCSDISGGAANGGWTIHLKKGENTLDGQQALAYARTRKPSPCPGKGPSAYSLGYDDLDRAAAQQNIINGIKSRLTSPWRLPYNFIKGPIIGWNAPKAFVSDMGMVAMPQLVLSTVFASSSKPDVLVPTGTGPGDSLIIPESERHRAAKKLEGG